MAVDTDIREAMRHVIDPEIGVNIIDAVALLLFMFNTAVRWP
jgi:Iron-sulfur cluster assembly protein